MKQFACNQQREDGEKMTVNETWHVGLLFYDFGTKLLVSGVLNFGPCAARGHPELRER